MSTDMPEKEPKSRSETKGKIRSFLESLYTSNLLVVSLLGASIASLGAGVIAENESRTEYDQAIRAYRSGNGNLGEFYLVNAQRDGDQANSRYLGTIMVGGATATLYLSRRKSAEQ